MASIMSRQPFKGIATILFLLGSPPYLATLSLCYFTRLYRPLPTWSLRTTLGVAFFRFFYKYASLIRLKPWVADPSRLKERYVLVKPGPPELYTGPLNHPTVKPAPVSAIWLPKPLDNPKNAKVVIHFQGGAFVTASDPEPTAQGPAKQLAITFGATVLWAQYRLSRDEGTRFPAALQDVVTFYHYVLELGVRPSNVIISGDSAGGNLVVGLLRYIEESKRLPAPRGAIACSPWVNISKEAIAQYARSERLNTDFIPVGLVQWGRQAYEPLSVSDQVRPYLQPVNHPFRIRTPLFVNIGTEELLYDEVLVWVERMKGVEGNRITLDETKDAPHDVILAGVFMGFDKGAEALVEEARRFFESHK